MRAESPQPLLLEAEGCHQLIIHRIATRAQAEGAPLTSLEFRQFDSDRMSKDEFQKFENEFGGVHAWQPFLDRISGLLKRAIAEDAANDPTVPARYDEMVHKLEDRPESFTLWACCVPAISGYKANNHRTTIIVWLAVLAVIVFIVLHALKIL